MKIPSEITELTVQEYQIIHILEIIIYVVFGILTFFNIIHYFLDNRNSIRKTGYLLAIFSISFIFIKEWPISIFGFLSSIIILYGTIRERWVETNSITAISIIGVLVVLSVIVIGMCFVYQHLGIYILNKENENELAYRENYFEYVTELDIEEPYINVKSNGKFGYINPKGENVINFEFDYASPFVRIEMYNKHFEIALVCKDGSTWIILKNLRKVLTYRSETMDEDYDAKIMELEDIYYNVLGQENEMQYEINTASNNYKVPRYQDDSDEYTYRYDYNEEFDIIVKESSLGLKDTYELVKKDGSLTIPLECEKLYYDENYLYIYSDGTIPFYNISKKEQGWFTSYGAKGQILKGKAQILEIFENFILIKNHNDNTIYFIDLDGKIVSDVYKEIFICNEDRFIVKNKKNKYIVINSKFEKVFDGEWDFVDASLVSENVYIFGTTKEVIDFNDYNLAENMKMQLLDYDGNVLMDNVEQVYGKYYNISDDKSIAYSSRYSDFLNVLKTMDYDFIGDRYYE